MGDMLSTVSGEDLSSIGNVDDLLFDLNGVNPFEKRFDYEALSGDIIDEMLE